MMKLKKFKVRCSQISNIMGKLSGGLTEIQAKKLKTLQDKGSKSKELTELLAKKDQPKTLPKTCISYLEKWANEQLFNYKSEIKSVYLDKGNECEDTAIQMVMRKHNLSYNEKNEQFYENEYLTGTPDLIYPHKIFDTKCSFTPDTFPTFADKPMREYNYNYWCQGQGYMELCSVNEYSVEYCLVNTPAKILERIINKETAFLSDELAEKKANEIIDRHTFTDTPLRFKVKSFPFAREPQFMQAVYERVELCREYIKNHIEPKLQEINK